MGLQGWAGPEQAPPPVRTLDPGGLFLVAPASFPDSVGLWCLASGPALGSYRGSGAGCVLGTHSSQLVLRTEMFKGRNDRSAEPPCWASLRRSLLSVRGVRTLTEVGHEVWMPMGLRERCLQGWGPGRVGS